MRAQIKNSLSEEMSHNITGYKTTIYKLFTAFAVFLLMGTGAFAQEHEHDTAVVTETHEELAAIENGEDSTTHQGHKFEAGKLIMEHIGDSHEWHLWGNHEHPVSIPLPVIIYSSTKGVEVFSSSRFEHGHVAYNGYRLEEGKIVAEDGSKFYDLSITKNVLAMLIALAIMLFLFISVANTYKRKQGVAPTGLQNAMELLIVFVRDNIAKPAIGNKHYVRFMPYLLTIFFFIWISNLLGLIPIFPGGANVTSFSRVCLCTVANTILHTYTLNPWW